MKRPLRLRSVEPYDTIRDLKQQIVQLLVLERKAETPEAKVAIEKRVTILTERLDELMEHR